MQRRRCQQIHTIYTLTLGAWEHSWVSGAVGSPPFAVSGLGQQKDTGTSFWGCFFLPCSLHVCIIKNLGLSARKYRCSWPVACGPCKGRHNRDFVLNSCPDCNFILSKSLIVPGVQRCYADLLLKAPSSWCDLHALMQVFWVCCVMEMELTYKAILVCHLSCHFTHFHNCLALFTAK